VTAWSGLFDGHYGSPYSLPFPQDRSPRKQVATQMLHRGMRADVAMIVALLGATAGGTATSTYARKKDPNNSVTSLYAQGGKQVIETVSEIDRVTTTTDTANLKTYMFQATHDLTLKLDSGGNSIKGKPGTF
jgi:predicted transcriptional regulator